MSEESKSNGGENALNVVIVSREDRLESENLHLRAMNKVGEIQNLQQQIQSISRELEVLKQQISAKRKELEEKYGVNMTTHQIRETDGAVVPRQGPAVFGQQVKV